MCIACPPNSQTSCKKICQTLSGDFVWKAVFPLSWSHYVRLMAVEKRQARAFYEAEAIRGGWSVRQLDRQIGTQFFERTSHSKQQAAMFARGQKSKPEDAVSVEDEVRDPYLLEFLNLKDEYSENSMGHMPAKVFASRYLTVLPDPETLCREILESKHALETRAARRGLPHAAE